MQNEVRSIMKYLTDNNYPAYLVGGYVRSLFMDVPSNDYDIEVYNISPVELAGMLTKFGKVDAVGKAFGVIKVRTDSGTEYDFSVPRYESKIGVGHKDFAIHFDTSITPYEASLRRNYTVNAMLIDVNGELHDFHKGIEDIHYRVLRPTSPQFKEDALRVLIGMQQAARFDMVAADLTCKYAREMMQEYHALPVDRIMHEWMKFAKGKFPRRGIEFLYDTGWIELYPELNAITDVEQNPRWHPEIFCVEHTMQCMDYAATKYNDPTITMAMLVHDLGKAKTTVKNEKGDLVSPGHADPNLGCNQFLDSIGLPNEVKATISELTQYHMHFSEESPSKRSVRRVMSKLDNATIDQLWKVIECDRNGRDSIIGIDNQLQRLIDMQVEVESTDGGIAAKVMGRHLINLGFKPSPKFGPVLDEVYNAQIEHDFDFDMLIQIAIALMTN